ncbi:MAG: Uncharacterised protein [Synechococcus sp. CC9902]|nr:MAG: Uncharacterised protein [Synechococcus sp. CC9902]
MRVHCGQHLKHRRPVPEGLAHADDATAAQGHPCPPHPFQGFQAFLIGPCRDDPVVVLRACVEVVVVGGEPCLGQSFGLLVGEHPRGDAGFHPHSAHPAHHFKHRLEGRAIPNLSPGPAHAEPVGTGFLGSPCPLQHRCNLHLSFEGRDITAVVNRLGAVGTVLLAASGFDAQQRCQLHPIARIGFPMDRLGLPQQFHQRKLKQGLNLLGAPVVADVQTHDRRVSRPPKRRCRL